SGGLDRRSEGTVSGAEIDDDLSVLRGEDDVLMRIAIELTGGPPHGLIGRGEGFGADERRGRARARECSARDSQKRKACGQQGLHRIPLPLRIAFDQFCEKVYPAPEPVAGRTRVGGCSSATSVSGSRASASRPRS